MALRSTFLLLMLLFAARASGEDSAFVPFDVAPWPVDSLCVMPEYPKMAAMAGVGGRVTAWLHIDDKGKVTYTEIACARPRNIGFEQEVLRVCGDWKFVSATLNSAAVAAWIPVEFSFECKTSKDLAADSLNAQRRREAFVDSLEVLRRKCNLQNFTPPPIYYFKRPVTVDVGRQSH